jgi:ketosteroid isomerase-like protein
LVSHGLDELEDAGETVVPITREVVDRGPCVVVPGEMQIRRRGSVRQTQVWWVIRVRNGKVLSGEDCVSREQREAAVARCAEDCQP